MGTQDGRGVFRSVGSVIHTDMVSGASGDLALTAFVLGALLEVRDASLVKAGAIQSAAAFLAGATVNAGDVYATAVRAYVLNLACKTRGLQCAAAASALDGLLAAAVKGAPFVYWSSSGAAAPPPPPASAGAGGRMGINPYTTQAPSNDVELTGYAVLALVTSGRLADALSPARWLLTQRSAMGGYRQVPCRPPSLLVTRPKQGPAVLTS